MGNFSERTFLVRALVGVFVIQFATVGYQVHSCQTAVRSKNTSENVALVCNGATVAFNETSKLALTTFLALLVPSAGQSNRNLAQRSNRKVKPEGGLVIEEDKKEG